MFTNTKIALAAALILGSASAALAGDSGENHQDNDRTTVSAAKSANSGAAYGSAAVPMHKRRPVQSR